jgi:hypothetical protein
MLFNANKFLEDSKRIHLNTEEISVSDNLFPWGGYGIFRLYHIRPGDLSRSARYARSPP